ncbi:PadR family transcriptional regulator [Streptomyces sp. NPDC048639]|uniref:PadR family transcriptional regulator n=1 Tax=Streptomyces sp. NPDC048639 TaxID=3365581 RepID=UPI0037236718
MTSRRALSEQDYLILVSISPQPLHGYAITQQIKQLTADVMALSPGTLYKALDRMLAKGWIEISGEEIVNSRLRRNYRLTGAGRAVLDTEVARRSRMEKEVRRRLRGPALGEAT